MPDIVLIAHGSPDPRHADDVERLADAVRNRVRAGRAVGACYLDHHEPTPDHLAVELTGRAVAVPLLLTPAYHAKVDVPQAVMRLRAGGADVRLTPPLGRDERLLDACEELLASAGIAPDPDTAVVVFVASFEGPGRDYVAQIKPVLAANDRVHLITLDALANADRSSADVRIERARQAGYDLSAMRERLGD